MNPPETQSDSSSSQETYFDPEAADSSEQFFSASLEGASVRPEFVVTEVESENIVPALPVDVDVEGRASRLSSSNEELTTQFHSGSAAESSTELREIQDEAPQTESDWRDLVSAKVKHYKTLKPRKARYPSLQLQFDPPPVWRVDPPTIPDCATLPAAAQPVVAQPVYEANRAVSFEVTTETTARVLEFPRPGMLPFNRDELAEPVNDRPRIVEAPELVPPPPALGGILIEPASRPEPERQAGLDMPFITTPLARRFFAAAIDGVIVSMALTIFGYMFLRFNVSLPQIRTSFAVATGLFVILWFSYQYAFLNFCGTTPGLRGARLKITHFDGSSVSREMRRWRVLASILSCVSLGLGYAWCFFDEDELSWHDRITKTHPAPK